jgi:transcription initiation factor TFIIIB Brf1 subunit/transcription initiation factor TFIIB
MNQELIMLAKFISTKIENENIITDNNPQSITAGIIYFISQCCGLNISKQDIRQVCGVSEVTTNKCFKKLELSKDQLIPKCLLDKYTNKTQ